MDATSIVVDFGNGEELHLNQEEAKSLSDALERIVAAAKERGCDLIQFDVDNGSVSLNLVDPD